MFLACHLFAQKKTYSHEQAAELIRLKHSVEKHPDDLTANRNFIDAWGRTDSLLLMQYNFWLKKYPASSAIPLAIAERLSEDPKAERYLRRALFINPRLAGAWEELSYSADRKGETQDAIAYMKKAVDIAPQDPRYAFNYAYLFSDTDTGRYHTLLLDLIERFPKSQFAEGALASLAWDAKDTVQQTAYYELIKERFDKVRGLRYLTAMDNYYWLLLFKNPAKALKIANTTKQPSYIAMADTILRIKQFLNLNQANQADSLIRDVQFRDFRGSSDLLLFKAMVADRAQHTKAAYDSIKLSYRDRPSDTLRKSMLRYGKKLGLSELLIDTEIKNLRDSTAKQVPDVSFYNYYTKQNTRLLDYRGKVILLTYWFPGCGPCRHEFPFFEKALKGVNAGNVVYLGINIAPEQDSYVLPLMTSSHYSFIPLRNNSTRSTSNLKAYGAPTNYLIDREGRIIFSGFQIDGSNEDSLDLMLKYLLNNNESLYRLNDSTAKN